MFLMSLCCGKGGQVFSLHDTQREHPALAGEKKEVLLSHAPAVTSAVTPLQGKLSPLI